MRFSTFVALACVGLHAASALPVFTRAYERVVRDDLSTVSSRDTQLLAARTPPHHKDTKKHVPTPPSPITFEKGVSPHSAHNDLDALHLHSGKRKTVENYHKQVVGDHMKTVPAAHSAVIKNLAHSTGSRDPHIHISAEIKDPHSSVIGAPRRGHPAITDPIHHVYVNKENPADGYSKLPKEYTKAVDKKRKSEGRPTGTV
ncbi:hypothetical protein B0H34DRAFT_859798 [Crassisporium funariophilum]|nr:hypothetical protein B0H34DRAFT_859798 [Crassisporium funariophilum]